MNINSTMRNIKNLLSLKNNMRYSVLVSDLELEFDGARLENVSGFDLAVAQEKFKEFVMFNLRITDVEYYKLFESIKEIDAKTFSKNPYLKLNLSEKKIGNFSFKKIHYGQNEFTILDEPQQNFDLLRKYKLGVFNNSCDSYVLYENDDVWMSVNPMEIETSRKAISNASGNVLVLGCGIGYVPYMMSLKENVKKITIIEQSDEVIQIFKEVILPEFHTDKIEIVKADAFTYLDVSAEKYDYIYVDVWKDNVNGLEDYKFFVKYEDKFPNTKFDYWLENSLLDTVIVNIYQYFSAKLGTEDYQRFFATVSPDLWNVLEKIDDSIDRPDQMSYYLTRSFAKKVLKSIT